MNEQMNIGTDSPSYGMNGDSVLPYHWDGECQLVLNDNFYVQPQTYQEDDPLENLNFEIESNIPFEKMEDSPKAETPKSENILMETIKAETSSVVSSEASGASIISSSTIHSMQSLQSLDSQLDFIMETTKKHKKAHDKGHRRNRKTPAQLKTLLEELGDATQNPDKSKIKSAAEKTGLTELQVYKWYWDRKSKI